MKMLILYVEMARRMHFTASGLNWEKKTQSSNIVVQKTNDK